MGLAIAIVLILCGVLAASNLIIAKRPDAQKAIESLTPIRGWIGLLALLWGLYALVNWLMYMGTLLKASPIWAITFLLAALVQIGVGYFLSYPMLAEHLLSKNEAAKAKGAVMQQALLPHQTNLGLASIALGLWSLLVQFVF